jgi:hypothetical protein
VSSKTATGGIALGVRQQNDLGRCREFARTVSMKYGRGSCKITSAGGVQ